LNYVVKGSKVSDWKIQSTAKKEISFKKAVIHKKVGANLIAWRIEQRAWGKAGSKTVTLD
jgi:hypothetical protein